VLPEPMTHPRSLAQAPFGYAQGGTGARGWGTREGAVRHD